MCPTELQAQRKRLKLSNGEGEELDKEGDEVISQGHTRDELAELFKSEISSAKAKFSEEHSEVGETLQTKPSFGHRAGFDAFMTGYSFASAAVSSQRKSGESEKGCGSLSGVEEMKNKLASRRRGQVFPLQVMQSHFTSTSQQHKTALANINTYFKKSSTSH